MEIEDVSSRVSGKLLEVDHFELNVLSIQHLPTSSFSTAMLQYCQNQNSHMMRTGVDHVLVPGLR